MDYKSHVIDILHEKINIDKNTLLKIIDMPRNLELGDYSIPCFKLKGNKNITPVEIAKNIKERLQSHEYFEHVQQVGVYVNIYINKSIIMRDTINKILKEKEYFGSGGEGRGKSLVINSSIGEELNGELINLEKEYVIKIFKKILSFQEYNVIDITNDRNNSEENISQIVMEIEKKGLLSEYNKFKVVNLKEYKLPPFIIIKDDGTFSQGIKDLVFISYVINKYKGYKFINLIEKNKWIYLKQIKTLSKILEYDLEAEEVSFSYYNYKKEGLFRCRSRMEEKKNYEILMGNYNKLSCVLAQLYKDHYNRELWKESFKREEFEYISNLGRFPDILKDVIREHSPNKLVEYLIDISMDIQSIYGDLKKKSKDFKNHHILLMEAYLQVLKNGINLIEIKNSL